MNWFSPLFNIYLSGGEIGKMTVKKLAKFKNQIVWQNVFSKLLQDALNRYHFEGLPDTISERVLLQSLVWYGSCAIFEKNDNLLALPCVPNGAGWNIYGDPASGWLFSNIGQLNEECQLYLPGSDESAFLNKTNGVNPKTAKVKGVFIRENAICYPFIRQVMYYSDAIADTMRTLDVCRANIKQPYIIVAEESIVNSVKKFFADRNDNMEYIVSSGVFPADKIKLLPFETNSDALKDTTALVDWYYNKYKELCGVDNNSNIDKKGENLISQEININEEYTDGSVDECMKYIQKSVDDVNKLYGTPIRVVRNNEAKNIENNESKKEEGAENEEV